VAAKAYGTYVRETLGAAGWPWPEHVLCDPGKQPRFVHTIEELIHEMQLGNHMNEVVVFTGGLQAVGQREALHPSIAAAAGLDQVGDMPLTAYDVLERLSKAGSLEEFKGKVTFRRKADAHADVAAGGRCNAALEPKWQALREDCPESMKGSVYMAEVRRLHAQSVAGEGLRLRRRSTLATTMRERLHQLGMDVRSMLFWDDFSEGMFCGGGFSAYDLHVDCIPTSNVGSVFAGHKLLAIWRYPEDTRAVMREHGRELFVPPLTPKQVSALERACCVALAPPGSIYIFSGTNAHAVCNVGIGSPGGAGEAPPPSLVVSSYEAFVGLNRQHVDVLLDTCSRGACVGLDASDTDSDLEEFMEEVVDTAHSCQKRLRLGEVNEPEAVAEMLARVSEKSVRARRALAAGRDGKDSEASDSSGKENTEGMNLMCLQETKRQRRIVN